MADSFSLPRGLRFRNRPSDLPYRNFGFLLAVLAIGCGRCHNTDAQGKYAFATVGAGWYRLEFRWKTNVNPIKSNPVWGPIFMDREGEYLITFLATRDEPRYHGMAIGEAFQYSGTEPSQKDLALKL